MINITIKRGIENLSGKWNGKFYYSNKKKKDRRIYLVYDEKESQEIHLSQKEYTILLKTNESFIKQEDIQIKLKIFKLFEKLSLKARSNKWYLMANFDKINNKINFVFLDTGFGIPKTINKNYKEKVAQILQNSVGELGFIFAAPEAHLIESALQGGFRTKTNQHFRGKGLPCIYEFYKNNYIQDLIIISNYGYIDCVRNYKIQLMNKFHGTLYSWSFS